MRGVIYGLYCSCSKEIRYVGLTTKSTAIRLKQHLEDARYHDGTHKCRWMRKHQALGHTIKIRAIEHPRVEELVLRETYWITQGQFMGWRLTNGRAYEWTPASAATRAKMSKAMKGRPAWNKGKPMSAEQRKKLSDGRLKDPSKYSGKTPWNKGLPMDDVTKFKISQSSKGKRRPMTEARRAAQLRNAAARRGAKHSLEARAKMSLTQRSRVRTEEEHQRRSLTTKLANHRRWHVARSLTKPDCEFCSP